MPGVDRLGLTLPGDRPERFYRPAPSASGVARDWLGMFLDDTAGELVDRDGVADILEDAYRLTAPKGLVARLARY